MCAIVLGSGIIFLVGDTINFHFSISFEFSLLMIAKPVFSGAESFAGIFDVAELARNLVSKNVAVDFRLGKPARF